MARRTARPPAGKGLTAWSTFPSGTHYFDPSHAPLMINYRVNDLRGVLDALRKKGVTVDEKIQETDNGRFGWVMDPEGSRIEPWEPKK